MPDAMQTDTRANVCVRLSNILCLHTDVSWHGLPDPVQCPEGQARKSVAIYYVSDARAEATPRYKASYRPRPGFLNPKGLDGCDMFLLF
jgi:hypothetical protein